MASWVAGWGGEGVERICAGDACTACQRRSINRPAALPLCAACLCAQDRVGMESLSNALELARRRELPPHLEKRVSVMCTKSPEYDPNLKGETDLNVGCSLPGGWTPWDGAGRGTPQWPVRAHTSHLAHPNHLRRTAPHLGTHLGPRAAFLSSRAPDAADPSSSSCEPARPRAHACAHARAAYTLDFQGRVREASVKNFQLVSWDHNSDRCGGELLLQFGKMDEDVYALDFTYPFNVEVAFAVALASIDTKLCYTI